MICKAIVLLAVTIAVSANLNEQLDELESKAQELREQLAQEEQDDVHPTMQVVGDNLNIRLPRDADMTVSRRTTISVTDIDTRLSTLENQASDFASKTQLENVRAAASISGYHAAANATAAMYDKLLDFMDEFKDLKDTMVHFRASIQSDFQDFQNSTEVMLDQELSRISTTVQSRVDKVSNCNQNGGYLKTDGTCASFQLAISSTDSCSVKGQVQYNAETGIEVCDGSKFVAPKSSLTTYRQFYSGRGEDNGYVPDRWIKFKKINARTIIKVTYSDNSRIYHCNGCTATWDIHICDANGNNCDDCVSPGILRISKYTWYTGASGSNLHHPVATTGVCHRSKRHTLQGRTGSFMLKVKISSGNDAYTGHNSNIGSLIVEELEAEEGK